LAELGPHLTQCRLCRGLPPYQVADLIHTAVWPQRTWAENWELCPHFVEGELGPNLTHVAAAEAYIHAKFHLNPSNHLTTIHQSYGQTDRQTDRQDNGPLAYTAKRFTNGRPKSTQLEKNGNSIKPAERDG